MGQKNSREQEEVADGVPAVSDTKEVLAEGTTPAQGVSADVVVSLSSPSTSAPPRKMSGFMSLRVSKKESKKEKKQNKEKNTLSLKQLDGSKKPIEEMFEKYRRVEEEVEFFFFFFVFFVFFLQCRRCSGYGGRVF
jgi:hypothetical protein